MNLDVKPSRILQRYDIAEVAYIMPGYTAGARTSLRSLE